LANNIQSTRQPLDGVRVIELGMFHAGPGGCAILGDLGAEVIKIEQPGEATLYGYETRGPRKAGALGRS